MSMENEQLPGTEKPEVKPSTMDRERLPTGTDRTEARDQTEDAALDRILAEPKPEKAEQPKEPEPEPSEQVDEEPEPDVETSAPPDVEKAITALRRDGIPHSVIKKMSQKEIVALSEHRSKVQADLDNKLRELGELKKQKESAPKDKESVGQAEPTERPEYLAAAVEPFTKEFGEEAGRAYGAGLEALDRAWQERVNPYVAAIQDLMADRARAELRERFPQLSDKDKYQKVQGKMADLAKTGSYESISDLMDEACRIVFWTEQKPSTKARDVGQPMTKSKTTKPTPLSQAEKEDAALDVILAGGTREDAMRAYGGG